MVWGLGTVGASSLSTDQKGNNSSRETQAAHSGFAPVGEVDHDEPVGQNLGSGLLRKTICKCLKLMH